MGDIAVRVEGLGKCFKLNIVPNLTLEEAIHRRMRRIKGQLNAMRRDLSQLRWPSPNRYMPPPREDFWALRDISFELNHGEVMGIIGPNGAGKSTLLKILTQVLEPTEGRAELHGRVGALLEVGTGFNPELTGRENIYLYGSILGMSRNDISKRFDEIVQFAEIEKFLDQPVKNYSTGMHSRLAFSVAAHLECDILLVDEVLSVGDAAFSAKCLGKMQDVTGQGRAVIFVSHNMSAVNNMCDQGIVLNSGNIVFKGSARDATQFYMEGVKSVLESSTENPVTFLTDESKPIQFRKITICNNSGAITNLFDRTEEVIITYEVIIREPSSHVFSSMTLRDEKGNILIHTTDDDDEPSHLSKASQGIYTCKIVLPKKLFRTGRYFVTPGIEKKREGRIDKHENIISFIIEDLSSNHAIRGVQHRQNLIFPEVKWQPI